MIEIKKSHLSTLERLVEEENDLLNYLFFSIDENNDLYYLVEEELVDLIKEYEPIPDEYGIDPVTLKFVKLLNYPNGAISYTKCEEDGPIIRISLKGLWYLHLYKKGLLSIIDDDHHYP